MSAHTDKALLRRYKAAKKYYTTANYEAAKAILAPLTDLAQKNDITPYALFYYALSAYHNEEAALAENILMTLAAEFPGWEQQDEVWYWLGQLRCEAKDHSAGLAYLAKISDQSLEKSVEQMKGHFLQQLDDLEALQTLHRQYPEDSVVAKALLDLMARQPFIKRDLALMHTLTRDFDLTVMDHDPLQNVASLKKNSYNVAVFFPFFVDEVDYEEEESSNAFVIALYQGIKMAVAALADQGVNINLFAYDTKKDPETTAALLEQEELKGMDLIIGPLYAATIPLVAEFAQAHQINVFNPLSENADVVRENPFVFLFQSSLETQARKAAEFTLQHVEEDSRVGIIYGTSSKDFIRAHAYKQYIEHSTGQEVAMMLALAPEDASSLLSTLNEAKRADQNEEEEAPMLNLDHLTHLYLASEDELTVASVLSAVAITRLKPYIIGHEAWLQQSLLTVDQLQQLRLYLLAPHHVDYTKESIHAFRSSFYDQSAQYPTHYACVGYEMMLFLGQMLGQHGVYFQKHWEQQFAPGTLFQGVSYGKHHDNQYVPIIQLRGDALEVCNSVRE
ncbi:MAG: ABC transporter substrate-binding protein [Bacteroidota bacterium]